MKGIRKNPYVKKILIHCFCLTLMCFYVRVGWAEGKKEVVTFFEFNLPPLFIKQGESQGHGIADLFQDRLAGIDGCCRFADRPNFARATESMHKEPNTCTAVWSTKIKDGNYHRDGFYISLPWTVYADKIVITSDPEKMKPFLNEHGQVSLYKLLRSGLIYNFIGGSFDVGIEKSILSYVDPSKNQSEINSFLLEETVKEKTPKNFFVVQHAERAADTMEMLINGRGHYTIWTPSFVEFNYRKELDNGTLHYFIPIEMTKVWTSLSVVCSDKFKENLDFIKKVNMKIVELRKTDYLLKSSKYYIPKGKEKEYKEAFDKIVTNADITKFSWWQETPQEQKDCISGKRTDCKGIFGSSD